MSKEQLEDELSEASSKARMWKSLLEHPAWVGYEKMLRDQMEIRKTVVMMTPINSEFSAFAQEFFKGEFTAINSMLEQPTVLLEQAEMEVRTLNKAMEMEDETEARMATASTSRVDTSEHFGD